MIDALIGNIAQHWFLATYFSVMAFNESAILAAFSLFASKEIDMLVGVALATLAGSLTNDLILYAFAKYGLGRFAGNQTESQVTDPESVFERLFLGNVFLSLLLIKFLFGVRLVLTVYLVTKKRIPLGTFIRYDLCGIALYVFSLGGIGLLVGQGNAGVQNMYTLGIRTLTAVFVLLLVTHVAGRLLKRWTVRSAGAE